MSDAADMSLQTDATPRTLLYMINGQKVDVGKATILNPKERLFHNQPIPVDTFRVSLASVKAGHEDLPPLV